MIKKAFGTGILIAVLLLSSTAILVAAGAPSEPHRADAMWVEPSSNSFETGMPNATVGQKFNVTVWLNMTEDIYMWQVKMHFNATQVSCARAGYTNGATSNYFKGHTATAPGPSTDNVKGTLVMMETCLAIDFIPGPHSDSLFWAEFAISVVPASGNLTSKFDISTEYGTGSRAMTYVVASDGVTLLPFTPYDANYLFIGPAPTPPKPLHVSISPTSASTFVNQTLLFTSNVTGGTPPYGFQWFLNSTTVSGAIFSSWAYTPASVGSASVYLNITDTNGTVEESNVADITVLPPLTGAKIYVDPSQIIDLSMGPGSSVSINITVANVASLSGCVFNLTYDPTVLTWTGFDLLPAQGQYPTFVITGNSATGLAWIALYYLTPITAVGQALTRLRFCVNSYGISPFNLTDTVLLDENGNPIEHNQFGGIFANIIRDVAVTNVAPSSSWVYQTFTDNINVTVANLGNRTESFSASASYDSTLIGTVPIAGLAPGAQTTVQILWDTTGVPEGNYTITGTASLVPYETYFNTTNNVYVDGVVQVLTIIHDVAVTAIVPAVSWAYANSTVPINVTASNLGNVSETFSVTAYYGANITIGTLPVTGLAASASAVLTFYWNTSGIAGEASYTLSAFASYVPFEYNTANNYLVGGQVLILTLIRDVAITNVTTTSYWASHWAYEGGIINVTVTANNTGEVPETFDVTAFYDTNLLGNVSVSLAPSTGIVEVFTLNTTGLTLYSNYTISARASIVSYEFNTANNLFVDGNITVRVLGDVNGDGMVEGRDIIMVSNAFMSYGPGYLYPGSPPSANWNVVCDLNMDNLVDGRDMIIVARHFGYGI